MALDRLSPDLLSEIVSCCSAFDIGNLWQCGSRRLQQLICHGGVTEFNLELVSWRPYLWPSFVAFLTHLRVLKVRFVAKLAYGPITGFDWSQLPHSLEHLSLQVFAPSVLPFDSQKPLSTRLTSLTIQVANKMGFSAKVDWNRLFPSLQELFLKDVSNTHEVWAHFLTPRLLPRGLLRLDADLKEIAWDVQNDSTASWPPQLMHLWLYVTSPPTDMESFVVGLPPSLVDFNPHFPVESSLYRRASLPNLQHLRIYGANRQATLEDFQSVPRGLQSLRLGPMLTTRARAMELLPHLPPNLTLLRCSVLYGSMAPGEIELLPKSITTIEGPYFGLDALASLPASQPHIILTQQIGIDLPSSLQKRTSCKSFSFDRPRDAAASLANLPPFLTDLSLTFTLTSDILPLLPATLTRIESLVQPVTSANDFALLPRGLKILDLYYAVAFTLPPGSSALLPPGLTHLRLGGQSSSEVDMAWLEGLPTSLTTLDLNLPTGEFQPENFGALRHFPYMRTWFLTCVPAHSSERVWAPIFANLPRTLTHFEFRDTSRGRHCKGLKLSDFSSLPAGLVTLVLPAAPWIEKVHATSALHLRFLQIGPASLPMSLPQN